MSPGLDFETRLFAKPDAAALLDGELRKPSYAPRVIAIGTNTDFYQPIEKTYRITRQLLEVLDAFNHPVCITTKGAMVTQDIDILSRMAKRWLARAMEPRTPTLPKRIEAIRQLAEAGIPVAVMIPSLNDHEMESILERAAEAGADQAGYVILRLLLVISGLMQEWLVEQCARPGGPCDGPDPIYAWRQGLRFQLAPTPARQRRLCTGDRQPLRGSDSPALAGKVIVGIRSGGVRAAAESW